MRRAKPLVAALFSCLYSKNNMKICQVNKDLHILENKMKTK